jgi:short-subunit dehydrogenase
MSHAHRAPARRYPGLAVVAGASEGIGAAFARRLAGEGFELLLVARRPGPLEQLAAELRGGRSAGPAAGVPRVDVLPCDLAAADAVDRIRGACAGRRVGLLVYNAASAPTGPFVEQDPESLRTLVQVNVATPVLLVRELMAQHGPPDREANVPHSPAQPERAAGGDGRHAVVLLSSMAGWQGTPMLAGYSASKAFLRVLGEALWAELRGEGVDVVVSIPGATDTPGYRDQSGSSGNRFGVLAPDRVASAALRALGRRPLSVPGLVYKLSAWFMTRLMPRSAAVRIMSIAGRRLTRR